MGERVSIKVFLEKEIILDKNDWIESCEKLPENFEEIEELERIMIISNLEIKGCTFNENFVAKEIINTVYPLKLSEIIAGCESGAWLDGASFKSEKGNKLFIDNGELVVNGVISINENWSFEKYIGVYF